MTHEATPTLEEVVRCLQAGNSEAARDLLAQIRAASPEVHDPEFHLACARLWAQLGEPKLEATELSLAVRDGLDTPETHRKIAELWMDMGSLQKAERHLKRVVELCPTDARAYRDLAGLYEEMGNLEAAAAVYRAGSEATGDPSLAVQPAAVSEILEASPSPQPTAVRPPTEAEVVRFTHLFSGREGVYARQWVNAAGDVGYSPVHEPLTPFVVRNHLLGNYTVGVYQLRIDLTVRFVAFDLDIPKKLLPELGRDRRRWVEAMHMVHRCAVRLVEICRSFGLDPVLEDSGFKGRHVWCLLEEPVTAKIARSVGLGILEHLTDLPPDVYVELFPKQIDMRGKGLGNLIKLPLGLHQRTGRPSVFLDPTAASRSPVDDQFGYILHGIKTTSKDHFLSLLEKLSPVAHEPPSTSHESAREEPPRPIPVEVRPAYDLARDEAVQAVLSGCPVLREIVRKAQVYHELSNDERVVITHSLGLLETGPLAVNAILSKCAGVSEALFLKSRLRGNPISCPKIRSRVPSVTARVGCACRFPDRPGLYPNPLMHLERKSESAPPLPSDVEATAEEYCATLVELDRLSKLRDELRTRLVQVLRPGACLTVGSWYIEMTDEGPVVRKKEARELS